MTKSKSWSVKGIAPETRDTARDAAQSAGMPIGSWIDSAIMRAARGELPGVPGTGAATAPAAGTTEPAAAASAESAEPANAAAGTAHGGGRLVALRDDLDEGAHGDDGDDSRLRLQSPQPSHRGPGMLRYAVVAVVFVALLAGGAFYLIELSRPGRGPAPETVATADKTPAATGKDATESAATAPVATPPADKTDAGPPSANVRDLITRANNGDATAQHDLGLLHLSGRYVEKDAALAAKWFEKAAVQGLANAQFNLGVLYQQGKGVKQDQKLSFFWYQSAAEQGFARAQHNLATAYAEGRGVPRNDAKAVEWFTRAAKKGLAASQYSLGMIYEHGLGKIAPDLEKARTWYASAADQGDEKAAARLADVNRRLATRTPPATPATATPQTAPEPKPADNRPLARADIRELQKLLNTLNFDAGPADGQMGPHTRSAIRLYQKFAGLPVDGEPTRALLEDLRAVSQTMSSGG